MVCKYNFTTKDSASAFDSWHVRPGELPMVQLLGYLCCYAFEAFIYRCQTKKAEQ